MAEDYEVISFDNKKEAEELLKESRNRIDEIDNELFDLIAQRTSLAKDIVIAKDFLGIPIYDKSREEEIHEKIRGMAEDRNLDMDIIDQIIDMLTSLSKIEQNKILRRNVDGKY